ncbi:MAG: hypothetical protein AAF715_19180 [Myxococcota bacterium]
MKQRGWSRGRRAVGAGVAVVAWLTLAGGGLSSCGATDEALLAALGAQCLLDSDCEADLACVFGRCHQACETSADCPMNQRCVLGAPPTHVCLLEEETNCTRTSDCPDPLVCGIDLQCRDACRADPDCLTEQVCATRTCALPSELEDGRLPARAPDGVTSCRFDSDCPVPQQCFSGTCRVECLLDEDCPSRLCDDDLMRCLPPVPGPPICVPNEQDECNCPTSGFGVQICEADGLGFGPCLGCGGGGGICNPPPGEVDDAVQWIRAFSFGGSTGRFWAASVASDGRVAVAGDIDANTSVDTGAGVPYQASANGDGLLAWFNGTTGTTLDDYGIVGTTQQSLRVLGFSPVDDILRVAGGWGGVGGTPPNFGVGTLPMTSSGVFLVSFNAPPMPVAATGFGESGTLGSAVLDLTVGPGGEVVLTGNYFDTIDFGAGPITTGGAAIPGRFLTLFDSLGNNLFARSFSTSASDQFIMAGTAVDANGRVFVTGGLVGTVNFGSGLRTASGTGFFDAAIAGYQSDGTPLFDAAFEVEVGDPVATSTLFSGPRINDGRVHVAGTYEGATPPDFGGGPLPGGAGARTYELAFDPATGALDTNSVRTTANATADGIVFDGANAIVWGVTAAATELGPCLFDSAISRPFIARRDANGAIDWVRTFDLGPDLFIRDVEVTGAGEVIAIIGFRGAHSGATPTIDVGSGSPVTGNSFIVKLDPSAP